MNNLMLLLGIMILLSQAVEKLASLVKFLIIPLLGKVPWMSKCIKKWADRENSKQLPALSTINFLISFFFIRYCVPIDSLQVLREGTIPEDFSQELNIGIFLTVLIASMGSAFISDLLGLLKAPKAG